MTKKRLQNMDRLSDRQLVALLLDNNDDAIEYVFFHRCDGMFAHIVNSVFLSQDIKKEESSICISRRTTGGDFANFSSGRD